MDSIQRISGSFDTGCYLKFYCLVGKMNLQNIPPSSVNIVHTLYKIYLPLVYTQTIHCTKHTSLQCIHSTFTVQNIPPSSVCIVHIYCILYKIYLPLVYTQYIHCTKYTSLQCVHSTYTVQNIPPSRVFIVHTLYKIYFPLVYTSQTTQTAHTLYLDRLSRPIVSRHAMLRFHVMFFD